MATDTPLELTEYYENLLIFQYANKPNAVGTIGALTGAVIMPQTTTQSITFSLAPTTGTFVLSYNGVNSASINWNDSVSTIQTKIQAVTGLSQATVAGSIASLSLIVTFTGVIPPALLLIDESNSLLASSTPVSITVTETDETLPLAVQDGFNLLANTTLAMGIQLDTLGKYAGVTRTGLGFTESITLDDADFLQLIRMAVIKNSAGSSLADIQSLLNQFFATEIYVFDYADMRMSYLISASLGSQPLIQLFITEGLIPVPMAVGVNIFYFPFVQNVFSFRTYAQPTIFNGFNSYADFHTNWPWLGYAYLITS